MKSSRADSIADRKPIDDRLSLWERPDLIAAIALSIFAAFFIRLDALSAAATTNVAAPVANTIAVTKKIYHGPTDAPAGYGVFANSLYFSAGDSLLRLSGFDAEPASQPLPVGLGAGVPLNAEFTEFDGSLFFHAQGEYDGNRSTFLHRLTTDSDVPVRIEVPKLDGLPPYIPDDYADGSRSFAEYDNDLYFIANRPSVGYLEGALYPMLYRIDDASSEPQAFFSTVFYLEDAALSATPAGPLFSWQWTPPRAPATYTNHDIFSSNNPASVSTINTHYGSASSGTYFDDSIFIAGIDTFSVAGNINTNLDIGPHRGEPGRPGRPPIPDQVELFRLPLRSGLSMWYDLNLNSPIDNANSFGHCREVCSSFPEHFVVVDDTLYFRASTDEGVQELFRMTAANRLPELVKLNQNGPSAARPLAAIDGQLWFHADIGDGLDLYILSSDGVTPIPLHVGRSVASTARGFTRYGNQVVFTARDDNNDWWTYLADLKRFKPSLLSVAVEANGSRYPVQPGLKISTSLRTEVQCSITNNTSRRLSPVRIRLRGETPRRAAQGSGKRRADRAAAWHYSHRRGCNVSSLDPGETTTCVIRPTVTLGTQRYRCVASAGLAGKNSKQRLRNQDTVYLTGVRRSKNDPVISVESTTVSEGEVASINVSLSQPANRPVSVRVSTLAGSARDKKEFLSIDRQIVFAPGEVLKSVDVFTIEDFIVEPNRKFRILMSEVAGGRMSPPGVVTIIDEDVPTLSIQPEIVQWTEGEDPDYVEFTVTLSDTADDIVTVELFTGEYGAEAGSDYSPLSETSLVFPVGVTELTGRLNLLDDSEPEGPESFYIGIREHSDNVRLGRDEQVSIYIFDND